MVAIRCASIVSSIIWWLISIQVLGNLSILLDGIAETTNYNRSLDLDSGIHVTTFSSNGSTYASTVY